MGEQHWRMRRVSAAVCPKRWLGQVGDGDTPREAKKGVSGADTAPKRPQSGPRGPSSHAQQKVQPLSSRPTLHGIVFRCGRNEDDTRGWPLRAGQQLASGRTALHPSETAAI